MARHADRPVELRGSAVGSYPSMGLDGATSAGPILVKRPRSPSHRKVVDTLCYSAIVSFAVQLAMPWAPGDRRLTDVELVAGGRDYP